MTGTIWPLMKAAAGETRKRAARATSSGVPQRPDSDSPRAALPRVAGLFAPSSFDPTGGEAVHADRRGERMDEAPRERHDSALRGCKKFAAIAAHAALGSIPAHVEDHAAAALFHFAPICRDKRIVAVTSTPPRRFEFLLEATRLGGIARQRIGPSVVDPNINLPLPLPCLLGKLVLCIELVREIGESPSDRRCFHESRLPPHPPAQFCRACTRQSARRRPIPTRLLARSRSTSR